MDDGPSAVNLADLVRQHHTLLYRYAYRLSGSEADAEDLTQQTYLTAQRKLHQLRSPEHARAWLCSILRNAFLKGLRQRKHTAVASLEAVPEPAQELPGDLPLDSDELQTFLETLPEEFRTPLILFYFDDMSYKEIAESMDTPIGTVMSRIARAKSHLRRQMRKVVPASTDE